MAQGQPIAPVCVNSSSPISAQLDSSLQGYQENDHLGYARHIVPGPAPTEATFPRHQVPAPAQPGAENIRRFASRYLHHPSSRVDVIRMEPGVAGGFKVVIILEVSDVL